MIVGIDLGTTHSLVATWRGGKAVLIPNALGEVLTPSCVSVDQDGSILVGRAARERLQTHPTRTAALFKRHMGSKKKLRLGEHDYLPEELSALVLRALKADAEAVLGETVTEAVITVPAYFSDAQRKATRAAGELAGMKVERLLNEPTAAALAYGLHQTEGETQFLVFDLGGGTFDVSILEMFEGVMEVRASAGDNSLGGEDFAAVIEQWFFEQDGIDALAREDNVFMQRLSARAERAKRELSEQDTAVVEMRWNDRDYRLEIERAAFEKRCQSLLARLWRPVERALRDARIQSGTLDNVVLAGGATRMPMVRQLVTRMFGRFPAMGLNPDEVVAMGAAVQAGLMQRDAALNEIVMTDVCPYTLGTEVAKQMPNGQNHSGFYAPIIERNTVVPVSKVERYWPIHDNQTKIEIIVYQGESRLVRDNIRLGQLSVPIAAGPRSESAVDVRFTYDISGLLEVEVSVVATGEKHSLVIENTAGSLSKEELLQRLEALAKLKIHPRDTLENRTLLAQAERQYEQLLGPARDFLGGAIGQFELALASQRPEIVKPAAAKLRELLHKLDNETYFDPDFRG